MMRSLCFSDRQEKGEPTTLITIPSVKSSWARATGFVYLLYFLTAVAGQALVSKGFALPGKVTNFISVSLYIVLGILLYRLFLRTGRIYRSSPRCSISQAAR